VGPLGEGRDPERPGRDQALTTVDADGPANGRIAQRTPLISRSATRRGMRHQNINIEVVPEPGPPR
jgi:hypothetical protein